MNKVKFKCIKTGDEIIVLSKSIFRVMDIKGLPYGDHEADGKIYEYRYDVVFNEEFRTFDEEELNEAMENMKFVGLVTDDTTKD